jgi:uncharacterized membrane protein
MIEKFPQIVGGYWAILCVVIVMVIGWYILMLAKDGWETKNLKSVFSGMAGWVLTIIFGVVIAIPLIGWMLNELLEIVPQHEAVQLVQKSVTETARFTVDIVDGDNTITLPDVSPERSRDPNIIIQKDGSSPQQNTPPQDGTDNDVYQEYLRNYYNQNGTPSQSINEPLGGVHPGQQPGNQPQTTAPPITSSQSYTIRRGDTLYKIARLQTGDGEKWRILCDLNFGGNKSQCDNLRVGQVIKLP